MVSVADYSSLELDVTSKGISSISWLTKAVRSFREINNLSIYLSFF